MINNSKKKEQSMKNLPQSAVIQQKTDRLTAKQLANQDSFGDTPQPLEKRFSSKNQLIDSLFI